MYSISRHILVEINSSKAFCLSLPKKVRKSKYGKRVTNQIYSVQQLPPPPISFTALQASKSSKKCGNFSPKNCIAIQLLLLSCNTLTLNIGGNLLEICSLTFLPKYISEQNPRDGGNAIMVVTMMMMLVMMMMITQQIPTMTKTHHGGNLSVMNMVGICR